MGRQLIPAREARTESKVLNSRFIATDQATVVPIGVMGTAPENDQTDP